MKLNDVVKILNAELLSEGANPDLDIDSACGSDLMSDVMAYAKENVMLLTGLINPQVIRTAEMMDIKVIVFVRGKKPGQYMLELAKGKGIAVMTTGNPMYIACGILYNAGITGRGAGS
jgi:hypothetical protein